MGSFKKTLLSYWKYENFGYNYIIEHFNDILNKFFNVFEVFLIIFY